MPLYAELLAWTMTLVGAFMALCIVHTFRSLIRKAR